MRLESIKVLSIFNVIDLHGLIYGPLHKKTVLSSGFENNKGADQPAHPRRLMGSFVIHFLVSIISKLATNQIPIFQLASVAEETSFSLALSETLKTVFVSSRPICA